jgi:glycosyltransferase involved in cell wall biosynthesis
MVEVSVAMATYNGGRHIGQQLDSLAAQHHLPAELVVVDDASNDETLLILKDFARTAPFQVRAYENAGRIGYRASFMRAASLCKSELISFCDQDDIWDTRKINMCVEQFNDADVLMVYHDADVVTAEGEVIGIVDQSGLSKPLGSSWPHPFGSVFGFTQIFHRSLLSLSELWSMSLDHAEPGETVMAHDQWYFFLASTFGLAMHLDARLAAYRQHGQNVAGWADKQGTLNRLVHCLNFHGRTEQLALLEIAALRRAAILKQTQLLPTWRFRQRISAHDYHRLAELYGARGRIYASANSTHRWKAFQSLIAQNGYRAMTDGGLGTKALVADLIFGIPAGHLLSRVTERLSHSGRLRRWLKRPPLPSQG